MKNVLKNSMLVAVLAGLFALPLGGFGFIELQDVTPQAQVLGIQSFPAATNYAGDYNLVAQVEVELNLGDTSTQSFYNVIPEEFLSEDYKHLLIIPNEIKETGLTASVEDNQLTADIIIQLNDSGMEGETIPATILILSR